MLLPRQQLTIVLNALYDAGKTRFSVSHPADQIGSLIQIELDDPNESTVRFESNRDEYADAIGEISRKYGSPASDELPNPNAYIQTAVASGIIELANITEIDNFLERYGSPDLNAGHRPVFAGFDTNLLPWRIADILDLRKSGYWGHNPMVNGFALATGVRDELDWDHKHSSNDVRALNEALGPPYDDVFNQPAGTNRQGRLGELHYRQLRDHQYADEVDTGRGDEEIINGYDEYIDASRKDVLLFSNDRNFVERARGQRILAQHVDFPHELPGKTTATWWECGDLLYMLSIVFGIIEPPKMTLYGVWTGKDGSDWTDEHIRIDCRSPPISENLDRDKQLVDAWRQ